MQEVLYLEIPTPDIALVKAWLQQEFNPVAGEKVATSVGIRLRFAANNAQDTTAQGAEIPETASDSVMEGVPELSVFVWSLQRTIYLKVFRWADRPVLREQQLLQQLTQDLRGAFPHQYPTPPPIDLAHHSIFEALAPYYPLTAKFFQKIPNGEYDLTRVYWWEQRWREGAGRTQPLKQVIAHVPESTLGGDRVPATYDLIYIGGALGVIHAAVMARLGYRVLLIERLPFGRMNREWNISRDEFQSLIDLNLFTLAEFESVIAREYVDGFNKFFDANNPPQAKAAVLHTPTVLNVGLDAEKLLQVCGEKLRAAGGEIWDETEFICADVRPESVVVQVRHLPTHVTRAVAGRLVVDAMGTASPIAWQLNGGRAFDSVCPTVGACIASGFEPGVWDANYGDVLHSHGDISRGRQLIWELFPGRGEEITVYLFHYHQVHPQNPGSLLEMYEDFFTILPEYRRCDMEKLVWRKATFGYIPGHFSNSATDRQVAFDRVVAIGDAASLQSPLVFTGFGSLVRNLRRLTDLLDTALKHDLLKANHLSQIRAYQSNVAVTWLFSKGMMVPTGKFLAPQQINAMLNTFFGILADGSPAVAERFIKDRIDWVTFNVLALKAAYQNPSLLVWIWRLAGARDIFYWVKSYVTFTLNALIGWAIGGWLPGLTRWLQPFLESRYPALWLWLLAQNYEFNNRAIVRSPHQTRPPMTYQLEPKVDKVGTR